MSETIEIKLPNHKQPVDYLIIAQHSPVKEAVGTRYNAGSIFLDYFANCMSMQKVLLEQAAESGSMPELQEEQVAVPSGFEQPVFVRYSDCNADVHDALFALSEADLHTGPKSSIPIGATGRIGKLCRVILVKPIVNPQDFGQVLMNLQIKYQINSKDLSKKLIFCFPDQHVLEGCIGISNGTDVRGVEASVALQSILGVAGPEFARIRIGVSKEGHLGTDIPPSREMNLLGHSLDLAGQSIQSIMSFNDIKATKKKYANNTKLPTTLRELPGLVFPVLTVELGNPANKVSDKGKGKSVEKDDKIPSKPVPERQSSPRKAGTSAKK